MVEKATKDINAYPVKTKFLTDNPEHYWVKFGDKHFKDETGNFSMPDESYNGTVELYDNPQFTQSVVFLNNSPEIRGKLIELGWKPFGYMDNLYIFCDAESKEFETTDDGGLHNVWKVSDDNLIVCNADEEELFLALVALRDDSYYKQWITYEEPMMLSARNCQYIDKGISGFSLIDENSSLFPQKTHKSTAAELIEHFRKNRRSDSD